DYPASLATIKRSRKQALRIQQIPTRLLLTMIATNDNQDKNSSEIEATLSLTNDQMEINENDAREKKKRKITPNTIIDTSILLEAKEMELLLEKSGQVVLTLSNQSMISLVAEIKTDLYRLSQPIAIDIKFLPENPYLAQQQSIVSYKQTQVIDDVLAQHETLYNEAQNLEQLNEDNVEGINELYEHMRSKMESEKEDQMEIALNIMIDREDTTEKTETKKISYSKVVGCQLRKRTNKVIEHRVDNGWTEEVK
ncbi:41780_t:CDS:2, partial [Gigaspora margarita]